jgi:hypothetical protein
VDSICADTIEATNARGLKISTGRISYMNSSLKKACGLKSTN